MVRYFRAVLSVAVLTGVQFAPGLAAGVPAPTVAHAQTPPPSSPPDLGLPPATPVPEVEPPAATASNQAPRSGEADEGSFGVTEPSVLVGALALVLGLGVALGAALYLRRYRRRQRELLGELQQTEDTVAAQLAEANRKLAEANRKLADADHKLADADRKLAEMDQQKAELLALVSHKLGTPVTAVKKFVDTMRLHWGELPEAARRDLLDRASLHVDELNRLVSQLRDFTRLDARRVTMTPQPILVSEAVQRALDDLRPVLADHHVFVDIPDGLAILADVRAFGDVLTHLLTNAVKFSSAGKRIIISASLVDGAVDMSISDEGSGIPREEQKLIFDPFYQSPTNKASRRGTGIGLTIAKRFIEMQGGEIAVVSEPGLGSTFWVTMPAADGPVRKRDATRHEVPL
jgi:signal transduction histidine kinase